MPTVNGYGTIPRVEFDCPATAGEVLASHDGRAGAGEGIVNYLISFT